MKHSEAETKIKHMELDLADVWLTRKIYEDAENLYYENLPKKSNQTPLAGEVAKVRQKLNESRGDITSINPPSNQIADMEAVIRGLEQKVAELTTTVNFILTKLK